MRRLTMIFSSGIVLCAVAIAASPVAAISNGQFDSNRHPNVACVLGQLPDGTFVGCGTGQLISSTVVLAAAHEFPVLESLGATRFFVSFDPTVDAITSEPIAAESVVLSPSFNPRSFAGEDLAVLLLSKPIRSIRPIQLPTAGLLDEMKDEGALSERRFIVVGYGEDCTNTVPCPPGFDTTRRFAAEQLISLQRDTLKVQTNTAATGEGGPCFGDSGSPHFLGHSNISVAVTHLPTGNCNGAVSATRLDSPSARSFLADFVVLS
jgi:Trypsin